MTSTSGPNPAPDDDSEVYKVDTLEEFDDELDTYELRRATHTVHFTEDVGVRADVLAGRRIDGVSRRAAKRLALAGHLFVDGERVSPSRRVAFGQSVELRWYAESRDHAARTGPALQVLARTPRYLYVNKPPGIHTHRLSPEQPRSLADMVGERFPECRGASPDSREGGAVHRLDRDTSGVVAFARSRAAWDHARAAFTSQTIGKVYLALVAPNREDGDAWPPEAPRGWSSSLGPGELTYGARLAGAWRDAIDPGGELTRCWRDDPPLQIRAPLGKGAGRGVVAVRPDGQSSRSVLQPLVAHPSGRVLMLAVELPTGRRHQARAHLAWVGLPIVGDQDYGGDASNPVGRLYLHAFALDLTRVHPALQESPVLAPLPREFLDALGPRPDSR